MRINLRSRSNHMKQPSVRYCTIISGVLLVILAIAHVRELTALVGALALLLLLLILAVIAGARLFPQKRIAAQFIAGLTTVFTLSMVSIAGVYWTHRITWIGSFTVLTVITFIVSSTSRRVNLTEWRQRAVRQIRELIVHWSFSLLLLLVMAGSIALLWYLHAHGTLGSVRTPWKWINQPFFFCGVGAIGR